MNSYFSSLASIDWADEVLLNLGPVSVEVPVGISLLAQQLVTFPIIF